MARSWPRKRSSQKAVGKKKKNRNKVIAWWWGWVRRKERQVTKVEFILRKHGVNISF